MTGIEPANDGFTIHCLNPLGYIRPRKEIDKKIFSEKNYPLFFFYDSLLARTKDKQHI